MPLGYPISWFRPAAADLCFCNSGQPFAECCGTRSEPRKPPVGTQLFPGFLDPAVCRKWVTRLEQQTRTRAKTLDFNRSTAGATVQMDDPRRVCHDVNAGVLRKQINERITAAFRLASVNAGHSLAWFETPRILRYQPGGFYLRHADNCQVDQPSNTWYRVRDRDLSLLIYLNEDFTGGGLTFVNFNYHFRPHAGDLLVFPSDNRYEHQAEVVESGVRYVIATWAAFSDSRRVNAGPPPGAIFFQGKGDGAHSL
jgi:predicted 2-oxoglutarate/Fe(II)-dependent dioxygenase YbiX